MTEPFDATTPPGFGQAMPMGAGAPAQFVPRLLAAIIDGLIAIAFYLPGLILFILASAIGGGFGALLVLLGMAIMAVGFLAFIYMIASNLAATGQTPGKRSQGVKVVMDTGQPLGMGNAVIRLLLQYVMNSICGIPLGSLWMLWDGEKKTLYDKVLNMSAIQAPPGSLMPLFPGGKPI